MLGLRVRLWMRLLGQASVNVVGLCVRLGCMIGAGRFGVCVRVMCWVMCEVCWVRCSGYSLSAD